MGTPDGGAQIRNVLAHSEGFEPQTARFVAGYSIQLSYESIGGSL